MGRGRGSKNRREYFMDGYITSKPRYTPCSLAYFTQHLGYAGISKDKLFYGMPQNCINLFLFNSNSFIFRFQTNR